MLRIELAFYLGCLNLREQLDAKGEPACFPTPLAAGQLTLAAEGIYDVCLTLHLPDRVVGNDVNADGKSLVMITGANQGGKSTLLRSLGLAHLMMQSGMFLGAQSFRASVCVGVFTHYKREKDVTMQSGKLDEELPQWLSWRRGGGGEGKPPGCRCGAAGGRSSCLGRGQHRPRTAG